MDSRTYFLSFSRLAERTIAFWGHATTSGVAASDGYLRNISSSDAGGIDYFVSSSIIEDEGALAQRKYSERLILMRGMTSSFPKPDKVLNSKEIGLLPHTEDLPSKRNFLV
jgi:hypothetical protein